MRASVLMMAFLGTLAVGCSSDGGGNDTTVADTTVADTTVADTTVTEETTHTAQPGRILLTVTNVTGWRGKVLVALTSDNTARVCAAVDDDPFALAATPLTVMSGNPCGPASADVVFEPGTHILTLAIVTPGQQTPEASTAVSVEVDGDVTVTVDGAAFGAATGSPGTVSIATTPIAGQSGRVLILSVGSGAAGVCAEIDSNAFTLAATVLLDAAGASNPCSPTGGAKQLDPGAYIVTAGIYVPGEHAPSASTSIVVHVDGNVTATIDGTKLSR